jgi:hypothetical protein
MQRKRVERLRFEQWFSSIRASLDKAKLAEVLGSNPASSIFLVLENWGIVLGLDFEFFLPSPSRPAKNQLLLILLDD